jgi:amidase
LRPEAVTVNIGCHMDATLAAELAGLDAVGQASAAAGTVSATELLEAAIARLESARGLNAVITDLFDRGRAQAGALDRSGALRGGDAGPLAGVPLPAQGPWGVLAGAPEAMGSRALRNHVATETAWIVERYLAAGLVVFGKTNTPEWGNHCTTEPSLFGPTVNPWARVSRRAGPAAVRPRRRLPVSCPRVGRATAPDRSASRRPAVGWSD